MKELDLIQGKVVESNVLRIQERLIHCWTNAMQAAITPQPLDLSQNMGEIVEVSGHLHGDLWEAHFEKVVSQEGFQEITGIVVGPNEIEGPDGIVVCYRHGMAESWYGPLNLFEYMGKTITVAGELRNGELYRAYIVKVPAPEVTMDPAKEAENLNDLLRIREANREKIEAVNGNLGTALGFKWTSGQKTDHPSVIIFVPQKTASLLVPDAEKAPETLETEDGKWCFTDVVTGGKTEELESIVPPEISEQNKMIVQELKSGQIGLIGGIQLAAYVNGDNQRGYVGTAGIAVRHRETQKKGFLTNQHVADAPGRYIYHPWHNNFYIGMTYSGREYEEDETWYDGTIDEENSRVRCDCGFVAVSEYLEPYLRPGLHAIGDTGELLRINPDSMDIIDQKVISIGRTRGVQRGTIVAYAYEYYDDEYSLYTDLLIIGEDGKAFSWKGDSGKIIVTDDENHRPVALLWGGWQERLRHGGEQEIWTYAIDLRKVLDILDLELL
ncbi:hypothetical protein CEE37_12320 [candidate division LCP-89 bacterium B3_LCP]|uniref:Uncharacterized protein n=1 Tax=candidate division LCP-89 bacterium B3_LCP TaxID=2012998 RepID=A0A532UUC1_UNCL8|nr:MAG: hypothetical protein CEE37_12320 [candidate division LCP-89 bacterium B3_LCP]